LALVETSEGYLRSFLQTIYGDQTGYCYVALKSTKVQGPFVKHHFQWPAQQDEVINFILENKTDYEVYYSPALFYSASGQKPEVKTSQVLWCEFDGHLPTSLQGLPEPNIKVRSSTEEHEHWYWLLDQALPTEKLEQLNRAITYALGADTSAWNANQILRPLSTFNHKRQRAVELTKFENSESTQLEPFEALSEPPPTADAPPPDSVPPVEDVIGKVRFDENTWNLFKQGAVEGQRSDALMRLGYKFAEWQLSDRDCFTLLLNADERWGKFKDREDQHTRLMEIVTRARAKYPLKAYSKELESFGLGSLLATEVHLEWVWEGLLQEQGFMLLTGPSGVGKTQFSLFMATQLALGYECLDRPVTKPQKVGFFSLEMGLIDLKHFLQQQALNYSSDELAWLENNLRLFPLGEPLFLNRKSEKDKVEAAVETENLDGIFVDSLGSMTEEELTQEGDVKGLMNWTDHLRQKYQIFTWYIHHHRKATSDNKKPNTMSDIFGSMFVTKTPTSILSLWPYSANSVIQVTPLKTRLTGNNTPFLITRDSYLNFAVYHKPVGSNFAKADEKAKEDDNEDNPNNFTDSL
jgi:hypothetical protein